MGDATGTDTTPEATPPTPVTCIVNLTDGVENTIEAYFLEIKQTDIDDEKLSDLRSLIVKQTRCVELLQFPFCLESGAVVQDSLPVEYYLTKCLKMKEIDDEIEIFMKDERSALETGWNELVPSYYSSPLTGTNARHISELEEKQWNAVVETNQLCHGISVITQEFKVTKDGTEKEEIRVVGVQKPKYPAFRLAPRKILSDTLASSMVKDVELDLRIPRHVNDDQSYVSIRYSTNSTEESLAKQGFTQTDISASGSGGAFGLAVDVSASASVANHTASESSQADSKSDVTMSYNFPRVTIFLEDSGLELTPKCEEDLRAIRDAASYDKFLKKYGEFFSTSVQLGGSLYATETSEEKSAASREQTAKAMKAAAAAALGGVGYSVSVSASHQRSSQEIQGSSSASSSKALMWQANGGNTLLCNDPNGWAPSVAYYGNWRVLKQGSVVRLMDLISQLKGFEYVKDNIAVWKTTKAIEQPPVAQKFTLNVASCPRGNYVVGRGQTRDPGQIEVGPETETRTAKYLAWEMALAEDGAAATSLEYGKDYYMMHCETSLYPDLFNVKNVATSLLEVFSKEPLKEADLEPVHAVEGGRTRQFTVRFNDKDYKGKTGAIETGDTITVEFRSLKSELLGYLARQSSAKDSRVFIVTKRKKGYTPVKLTYTEINTLGSDEPQSKEEEAVDEKCEDAGEEPEALT